MNKHGIFPMMKLLRRACSFYTVLPIAIASVVPAIGFAAPAHTTGDNPKNHPAKTDRRQPRLKMTSRFNHPR
jgi:hypothetical protein